MADLTPQEEAAIRERLSKASPGPWFWNSYSRVASAPLVQIAEDWPEDAAPSSPRRRRTPHE